MISLYESYCSNHSESSDRLQDFKFDSDVMAILKVWICYLLCSII